MPVPVRALWTSASAEAQQRAHQTAVAVLRTWLGKQRREEAAKELGLSGVRFWQLSQQALAGLVAGCLRQPRFRGRAHVAGEDGAGALKQRIARLERELDGAQRLIGLLKDLPGQRAGGGAPRERADGAEGRRRKARVPADAGAADGTRGEARNGADA
jgi:hypothetical protein